MVIVPDAGYFWAGWCHAQHLLWFCRLIIIGLSLFCPPSGYWTISLLAWNSFAALIFFSLSFPGAVFALFCAGATLHPLIDIFLPKFPQAADIGGCPKIDFYCDRLQILMAALSSPRRPQRRLMLSLQTLWPSRLAPPISLRRYSWTASKCPGIFLPLIHL